MLGSDHGSTRRRSSSRWTRLALGVCLTSGLSAAELSPPEIHLADGRRPPVLDTFVVPEGLQALAVSPDGERAAVAVLVDPDPRAPRSVIRIYRPETADPLEHAVPGRVRDLLYLEDSLGLFAIAHHPAKRHEGDCFLLRVDLETGKIRREKRLPPSARGMDHWAAANSLLVASRDEIRTISFPLLRSGPLFRIPGENYAVAALGQSRVLVGQSAELLLVDLSDPQDREGLPVRERIPMPSPVLALAVSTDGSRAVARLADDGVHPVRFEPLRLESPAPGPDPVAPAPVVTANAPVTDDAQSIRPPEQPSPLPADEPALNPPTPAIESVASEPATDLPAQIRGQIDGPAAGAVVAVVLFGPDNLMHEAIRVRPDADGRYRVSGLAPGRYGVQLDGGGGRSLVTRPPTRTVVLDTGSEIVADFHVLRAL